MCVAAELLYKSSVFAIYLLLKLQFLVLVCCINVNLFNYNVSNQQPQEHPTKRLKRNVIMDTEYFTLPSEIDCITCISIVCNNNNFKETEHRLPIHVLQSYRFFKVL